MKIKIINLLAKIPNGEEIPQKIKYKNHIWYYDKMTQDYCRNDDDGLYVYLFQNLFQSETDIFINDEVEIIEEDEKIEHCKGYEDFDCMDELIEHLRERIDILIDEINKMKEGK